MKKYTVKDNLGNKKTVYADNLSHALTFVDSRVKDVRVEKGDWFTLRQRSDVLYKVIDDQNKSYNGFTEAMIVEKYKIDFADLRKSHEIKIIKVGNESFHPERLSTEIIRFNSSKEAIDWFKRQKELRSRKYDSVKDEASLATTINALVNDEKAAIDAYDVAIKNLEESIDDTSKQVLINIMKDERRHVENLYAILNGQVTEKNLEDSIHDSYVEVPLVLNRFQIEAIQENWFDIKDTGKKENGFPVYRLTGDKEKIFRWLRTRYDKKFPLSAIHDAVKSPSTYVNTSWVKNMLPNDLMAEGLKNDYSFNDVLKNFDAISSKILDVVKDALDEAKRDIIDFKRNYINALIN